MKVFSPTIEEFGKQCNELMDTLLGDPSTLEERVLAMSMNEYRQMLMDMYTYTNASNGVRNNLAKFLRNGFNPWDTKAIDENDPLRTVENNAMYISYLDVSERLYRERYADLTAVRAKDKEYRAHEKAIALERKLTICIEGVTYRAEKVIEVLYSGWECDGEAWLIKDGDTYKVATTNHGSHYFEDKDFLEAKIAEYTEALRNTKEFLIRIS